MSSPTLVEQHLKRLLEELELSPLGARDETKALHLDLSPEMRISMRELEAGCFFFAKIGPVPKQKREELFILLMKANFLGQGTGGSTIGLDGEEKFLTLSLAIPYDMNYKAFKESVEDFANFVDYWRKELVRHTQQAEENIYQ